ncbi:MAG TPA: DUF1772 domain-containing protein [Candidatus Xenobia bacterium]|jgi:uncharacterized membrane protein
MLMVQGVPLLAVWVTGTLAGIFCGTWWGQILAAQDARPEFFVTVHQSQNATYGRFVPVLMGLALLSVGGWLAMLVRFFPDPHQTVPVGVAEGLLLLSVVSTLVVNVPVNKMLDAWSPSQPPDGWAASRRRWNAGHVARAVFTTVAFLCLILCLLSR